MYDAWGNHTATYSNGGGSTGAQYNPFRYRGYYYDIELGLYYLNSRYYDSNTGRFISPDSFDVLTVTPDQLTDKNLYAYCDNNPITRIDGDGEFWNIFIGAAVGAFVGFVTSIVSQLLDENAPSIDSVDFWLHVGVSTAFGSISGGLAASGVGIVGQIAWNAGLSASSSIIDNLIDGEKSIKAYVVEAIDSALMGCVAGFLGGPGSASKHVTNSFKRVLRTHNWSYYFSQINTQAVRDGFNAIPGVLKATIPAISKIMVSVGKLGV